MNETPTTPASAPQTPPAPPVKASMNWKNKSLWALGGALIGGTIAAAVAILMGGGSDK